MSESVGSDIERYSEIEWWISRSKQNQWNITSFNSRVVLCRIRLFPTSISKIKWLESELSLKTYLQHISFWFANQWNWFSFRSSSGCTTNTMNIWFVIIWQCHIYNSSNWWNVQTTSSYIRTNKNITFAIFEIGFSRIRKSLQSPRRLKNI